MKINCIEVKNYRTLEDIKINFEGYYAAISGQNNAGKTSIMKVLQKLFGQDENMFYWIKRIQETKYLEDKTLWVKEATNIIFSFEILVDKNDDLGLFKFLEKIQEKKVDEMFLTLKVSIQISPEGDEIFYVWINKKKLGNYESGEIVKKLRTSNLLLLHNSTKHAVCH